MKLGVVGLPNVGKSTLFNAITRAGAEAANYPFCTIEPNTGVVPVPDARLDRLAEMYNPEKITPTLLEFVDIAGLVKGASKGEGLGNKFLSHIRQVDAIVHVVRCFEDENIVHVEGSIDPVRDIETIELELILADMESLERRIAPKRKAGQAGDKAAALEADVMEKIMARLEAGKPARSAGFDDIEQPIANGLFLLTTKPVLYAANIGETDIGKPNPHVERVKALATEQGAEVLVICARFEEEVAGLEPAEKAEFLKEMGLEESGLDRIVTAGYKTLGLISFLTAGPKEVRAWTIRNGWKAPQAAGRIHTDFEKGFIRAEIVPFETLSELGSIAACKEKGLYRSEGKEYVFKDGDVVLFRFNV